MQELLEAFTTDAIRGLDCADAVVAKYNAVDPDRSALEEALRLMGSTAVTAEFLGFQRTAALAAAVRDVLNVAQLSSAAGPNDIVSSVGIATDLVRSLLTEIGLSGGEPNGDDSPHLARLRAHLASPAVEQATVMQTLDVPQTPNGIIHLPIDEIIVGDRLRQLDDEKVGILADSIEMIGLQTPISVWMDETSKPRLVAGHYRLAALRRLGHTEVDARPLALNELDRSLWEIDENLVRAELTQLERDQHLLRRKDLFELRRANEVASGRNPPTSVGRKGFAADTEEKTGLPKRRTNESLRRIRAIASDVQESIKDLPSADVALELEALAAMPPDAQRATVRDVRDGRRRSIRGGETEETSTSPAETCERQLARLKRAWRQAGTESRQQFLAWVVESEQPSLEKASA